MADEFTLKKWKHPRTGKIRVYINGEPIEGASIWFEESQGGLAVVCTTDTDGTGEGIEEWVLEDAGAEGMNIASFVAKMALEDLDMSMPCLFEQVLAQAE